MTDVLNILIVDDNEDDAALITRRFQKAGYHIRARRVDTPEEMTAAMHEESWDAVISDVTMPRFSAGHALDIYKECAGDCPFIVVSGTIGEETAVGLLKGGAHDFLLKGNLARLVPAVEREMREAEGRRARRHAEEALRTSEERYALAASGANDGLWDWDIRHERVYYSPRWREMLGLGEGEVGEDPETWLGRIHPDDVAAVRASLDEHLNRRTPHFAAEYRIRHCDGQWRWMLARGLAVIDESGKPCRIAGSQTDISPHKWAEDQLRRAKENLELAMAAKTRFLAAASHDLRQPVQALLCFATLLRLQKGARAEATLSDMEQSLESLKSLLDALLDVSRLDAGLVKPCPQDFPVGDVVERVATEMRPLAEAKGLRLRVVASQRWVHSDPVLLSQIVRNLVDNAIRYTEEGTILIGSRRRGASQIVEVRDTGIGISELAQANIFEEFYQVGNPERDRMKGLGLGLAIVHRLSDLLHHPVQVRSVPGRGSSFAVAVPLGVQPTLAQEPAGGQWGVGAGRGTILVIEDERSVASALAGLLETWGYDPVVASSLEEAKATLRSPPRAIVADYRLREGRTGVEAAHSLRAHFAAAIPCVVVTGDTAVDRLRQISDSGSLLLHKPVRPADLRRALDSVLLPEIRGGAARHVNSPAPARRACAL